MYDNLKSIGLKILYGLYLYNGENIIEVIPDVLLHDRNDDSQLLEQELFRNNINIFCQYLVNNNQTIGMVYIIKVLWQMRNNFK